MNTSIKMSIAHKVVAINDSVYTMEVSYASMSMNVSAMGNDITFSSDDKGDATGPMAQVTGMVSKLLKSIINKPFTMELSKTGHVLSVKNMDVLFNSMFSGLPDVADEQRAQLKAQLEKSFGEQSIKNNFQQAFPVFPSRKIAVNDQWNGQVNIESTITAKINTTYTLKEITDKAYIVHGEGSIASSGEPQQQTVNGMSTTIDKMTGKLSTDYAFDKNNGWVINSKTNENLDATVTIKTPTGEVVTYPMSLSIISMVVR